MDSEAKCIAECGGLDVLREPRTARAVQAGMAAS